jgi:DNA-binding GntR family transcriptional regulator
LVVDQQNRLHEIPATISETIYVYVKKAVLDGAFKPNQRIQEKEIAGLYHVSTTPVREALRRLAAEKFLSLDARRGVVVAPVNLEDIKELFETVTVLDIFATKRALQALRPVSLAELKEMTRELGESYREKQILPFVKTNLEIHFKIWESCGNKFLRQTLRDLGEKFAFYSHQFFLLLPDPDAYFEKSYKDHLDLISALEDRDQAGIERILVSHWGKGFLGESEIKGG